MFPQNDGSVRVEAEVSNELSVPGKITVAILEKQTGKVFAQGAGECGVEKTSRVSIALKAERSPKLWGEFSPELYVAQSRLQTAGGRSDTAATTFGFRQFSTKGTQFCLNGATIFLRGKHDACVFPLTGYAPMDVAGWVRVFKIAKEYGINHYRFHSWCPPEAAFDAADRWNVSSAGTAQFWRQHR